MRFLPPSTDFFSPDCSTYMYCSRRTRRVFFCSTRRFCARGYSASILPPLKGRLGGSWRLGGPLPAHWANGISEVDTIAVEPAHNADIEYHAPRELRIVRIERTRPVVAIVACNKERPAVAKACRRQEDTITVAHAGHFVTSHTVLIFPSPTALFTQFS